MAESESQCRQEKDGKKGETKKETGQALGLKFDNLTPAVAFPRLM